VPDSPGGAWDAALLIAAAACATDLYRRRVPNVLTLGGAAAAIVYHLLAGGTSGVLNAVGGWLVGVAVFLPLFLLRGMGAGDLKLLGTIGAWVGARDVVWVAVYAAIAGGVMAVILAAWHRRLRRSFQSLAALLLVWQASGIRPLPGVTLESSSGLRLPYAVPILAGAILRVWARP
jgi:prepilin peptidase CpaA